MTLTCRVFAAGIGTSAASVAAPARLCAAVPLEYVLDPQLGGIWA